MVARLTPDQKAACSNHVGVSDSIFVPFYNKTLTKLNLTLEGCNFSFNTEISERSRYSFVTLQKTVSVRGKGVEF